MRARVEADNRFKASTREILLRRIEEFIGKKFEMICKGRQSLSGVSQWADTGFSAASNYNSGNAPKK
jgi:hypothetical protein